MASPPCRAHRFLHSWNPLKGSRPAAASILSGPFGPWQGRDVKREERIGGQKAFGGYDAQIAAHATVALGRVL